MLLDLFASKTLHDKYQVSFLYRFSRDYQQTVITRVDPRVTAIKVHLFSHENLINSRFIKSLPKTAARALRGFLGITSNNALYDTFNEIKLARIIRKVKPGILHVNNGGWPGARSAFIVCKVGEKYRIPRILHVHSYTGTDQLARRQSRLDQWIRNSSTLICCVSNFIAKNLIEERHQDRRHIRVIGNSAGLNLELYAMNMNLAEPSEPVEKLKVIALGTLLPYKGFQTLLDAVRILLDRGMDISCSIFGSGPYRMELDEQIIRLKIAEYVDIHDFQFDIREPIIDSDVLVQPSLQFESFGLTLVEAMVLGKPVIVSKVGGMPEVIEDGITGLLVSPGNADQLAEALTFMLFNISSMREMGRKGQERYWSRYSFDLFVSQVMELYSELESP